MGSFGKVFKGTWLCTDVAVKQIRRGASVSESIQRETMTHSRLRHPNMVTFMGISLKKKDVLLVTEFVAGSSLQDIIDEEKEVEETHGLVVDILKGVAYLHEPLNQLIYLCHQILTSQSYVISVLVVYGNMRQ